MRDLIRIVPDFPKPGILFKDITPLLQNAEAFRSATKALGEGLEKVDSIVAIESRGFIFGAAIAQALGKGLVLVRKAGKLPSKAIRETYQLEYGSDALEIHEDAILPGSSVVIIDDVLATGGTARAAMKLCERLGGQVESIRFLIELAFLRGRENLKPYPVKSLIVDE